MDLKNYSDLSQGFIQSSQSLALRSNHQRLTPEHLLKVLLDDNEGIAAGLINAAGGCAADVLRNVERELSKIPSVEGGGGDLYLSPEMAHLFAKWKKIAKKQGMNSSRLKNCFWSLP